MKQRLIAEILARGAMNGPVAKCGKEVVGRKEFAAEHGLKWYIFDTGEEARDHLQGVRAGFLTLYREGDGLE